MPNTDSFQAHPDFFSSKEEGKQAVRVNTNVRYKFFRQTHFTAGDYEQFLEHWDQTSHVRTMTSPNEPCPSISCPLYRHLTTDDVLHSFENITTLFLSLSNLLILLKYAINLFISVKCICYNLC